MCLIQCCVLKEVNSGQQMKFSLCYPECLSVGKRSCDFQRDSLINQHQTGWLENVEDIYFSGRSTTAGRHCFSRFTGPLSPIPRNLHCAWKGPREAGLYRIVRNTPEP